MSRWRGSYIQISFINSKSSPLRWNPDLLYSSTQGVLLLSSLQSKSVCMTTIYTTPSKLDLLPPHSNHHPHRFPFLSFPFLSFPFLSFPFLYLPSFSASAICSKLYRQPAPQACWEMLLGPRGLRSETTRYCFYLHLLSRSPYDLLLQWRRRQRLQVLGI